MFCRAIVFDDRDSFRTPSFFECIDEDKDQLDPCFAVFNRIKLIFKICLLNTNYFIENLRIIEKASLHIFTLFISSENLKIIDDFFEDRHINFMVDDLCLKYKSKTDMSNRDIDVLNKINPNTLLINHIDMTLENIKSITLLNCINIKAGFDFKLNCFELSFLFAPIQLFSFESTQRQNFESNSVTFNIDLDRFEIIKLIKTDSSNCLFIPFEAISYFTCSGLK